jgi:hypothetical protein
MTETRTGADNGVRPAVTATTGNGIQDNRWHTLREAYYNRGSGNNYAYFVFDKTLAQDPSCSTGVVITQRDHAGLVGDQRCRVDLENAFSDTRACDGNGPVLEHWTVARLGLDHSGCVRCGCRTMIVVGVKRPAVGLTVVGAILLAFGCVAFFAAVVLAL